MLYIYCLYVWKTSNSEQARFTSVVTFWISLYYRQIIILKIIYNLPTRLRAIYNLFIILMRSRFEYSFWGSWLNVEWICVTFPVCGWWNPGVLTQLIQKKIFKQVTEMVRELWIDNALTKLPEIMVPIPIYRSLSLMKFQDCKSMNSTEKYRKVMKTDSWIRKL